jgi:nitrite reductase (NADH) small subunit
MTTATSLIDSDSSKATNRAKWIPICKVEDIPKQGSRVIERTHGANIALFRTITNHVYALLDECPHKHGPLSQGIVHGEQVTCPLHAWNIQLEDGQAVLPDVGCTRKFSVKIEQDLVHLDALQLA